MLEYVNGVIVDDEDDGKNYKTTTIVLKDSEANLKKYCEKNTKLAKLFKNTVIYRCRQLYFAHQKQFKNLTKQEKEVLDDFALIGKTFKWTKSFNLPSYECFDKMFKKTENKDYYNELSQQSTQQIIKKVLKDFKSYKNGLIKYYKEPSKFTGKPKLPKYIKTDKASFVITNQDAVVKNNHTLKLPKTKETVSLRNLNIKNLKQVEIIPYYDTYKIILVEEIPEFKSFGLDKNRILGIDLGVNNFATTSNNCGLTPFIVNGRGLKARNQWYNKKKAELQSNLPNDVYTSRQIQQLSKYRDGFTLDFYHKAASYILNYCVKNNIGTVIVGHNNFWKQEVNMLKENNQNFCFIAHSKFIKKLKEQAKKYDINVIQNEESYTSKASFLDNDFIPTYKKNDNTKYEFSGYRQHRGLYKSKVTGILINADVNGASNIIRKVIPTAFDGIADFSYLLKTVEKVNVVEIEKKEVRDPTIMKTKKISKSKANRWSKNKQKCMPVKGLVAA